MAKILVIDDEIAFREALIETLTDLGHVARGVGACEPALRELERGSFDLVFVDFRLPGANGVETIKRIRATHADAPPIVMITAFADSQNTIEAMRLGAFDHLTKPVGKADVERIIAAVTKTSALTPPPVVAQPRLSLVGQSEALREVLKLVGRLAATDTTVLITGETGTGKEVVAQAIHANGPRASGPFVAVNCAAIPENLLESELFGHVRGAFTGAMAERKGSFQLAQGGTLFLDEIGDMDLLMQAKILRAVQEREVTPVGANKAIRVDCRIVAATHRDLARMVERKEFREDLFYRLNVAQLHLPPLRERMSDLPALAQHFLGADWALAPAALGKLEAHAWPGNLRELKNVLDRAAVIARGRVIDEDDIRLLDPRPLLDVGLDWHSAIGQLERRLLEDALREAGGNRSEAARKLGIQRQLLYAKMKEHQLG